MREPLPAHPSSRLPTRLHRPAAATTMAVAALVTLAGCAVPVTRTTRVVEPPVALRDAPVVERYGSVSRIEEVDTSVQPSGGGGVLGAVIGGVVGNQFGHGSGRAAATVLGAAGGALVGHNVEKDQAAAASNRYYRVYVRFDDGGRREFDYRDLAGLRTGDRVRVRGGVLERV